MKYKYESLKMVFCLLGLCLWLGACGGQAAENSGTVTEQAEKSLPKQERAETAVSDVSEATEWSNEWNTAERSTPAQTEPAPVTLAQGETEAEDPYEYPYNWSISPLYVAESVKWGEQMAEKLWSVALGASDSFLPLQRLKTGEVRLPALCIMDKDNAFLWDVEKQQMLWVKNGEVHKPFDIITEDDPDTYYVDESHLKMVRMAVKDGTLYLLADMGTGSYLTKLFIIDLEKGQEGSIPVISNERWSDTRTGLDLIFLKGELYAVLINGMRQTESYRFDPASKSFSASEDGYWLSCETSPLMQQSYGYGEHSWIRQLDRDEIDLAYRGTQGFKPLADQLIGFPEGDQVLTWHRDQWYVIESDQMVVYSDFVLVLDGVNGEHKAISTIGSWADYMPFIHPVFARGEEDEVVYVLLDDGDGFVSLYRIRVGEDNIYRNIKEIITEYEGPIN